MRRLVTFALLAAILAGPLSALGNRPPTISRDPYLGAIVVDADTGSVVFEDNADAVGYPASVLKLMVLLVVLEKVDQGVLSLQEQVPVTAEASKMGGSQVYLAEKETFSVDEMLYALMIQSANDAAAALAIRIAGSRDAFVQLMNDKAKQLGMTKTTFTTVHGLPPSEGEPDRTTPRDLAILGRELAKHPDVFRYTSTQVRMFRNNTFEMRNHNKLLGAVEGVDGFKTGYFRAAGFSIVATAMRDGVRVVAVVLGSVSKDVRDAKAKELIAKGFLAIPKRVRQSALAAAPAPAPIVGATEEESGEDTEQAAESSAPAFGWLKLGIGFAAGLVVGALGMSLLSRRRDDGDLLRR